VRTEGATLYPLGTLGIAMATENGRCCLKCPLGEARVHTCRREGL